jgi:N-acetylglucosamine malate deacetylase 1
MPERVLVVAAHPDDEVLGVGGTLARHAAEGDEVLVLILGEGATARSDQRKGADVIALMDAARSAAAIIGAAPPHFSGFPDNRMDERPLIEIVKRVEQTLDELRPTIVYTQHAGDLNIDHRIACRAVLTACRPLPGVTVKAIYAFETVSSTEWGDGAGPPFVPTRFVDIGRFLDLKLRALDAYASEMREFPHPRSREGIVALARLRGASAGMIAAEAFMVLREAVR